MPRVRPWAVDLRASGDCSFDVDLNVKFDAITGPPIRANLMGCRRVPDHRSPW